MSRFPSPSHVISDTQTCVFLFSLVLLYAKVKESDTDNGEPSKVLILVVRMFAVLFSLLGIAGAVISFGQGIGVIDSFNN